MENGDDYRDHHRQFVSLSNARMSLTFELELTIIHGTYR